MKESELAHSAEMNSITVDERLRENLQRAIFETVGAKYGLRTVDSLSLDIIAKSPSRSGNLDVLIPVVEEKFGKHNASLSNAIGKRLYLQLQLDLRDEPQNSLRNYVANARRALIERENQSTNSAINGV